MKVEKIVKFWLPAVLWAVVIFSFSSLPTLKTSEIYWQDFIIKKLAHLTEYAVLAVLLYRALKSSGVEKKKAGYWAILITLFYGITDEFHQNFTPGREPKIRDVVIDTIGGGLGIYLIWNLLPKLPLRVRELAKKFELV